MARTQKAKRITSCPWMRHKKVWLSTLNVLTGETHEVRHLWRTEACGTPLFGEEMEAGECASCAKGWECLENSFAHDANGNRYKGD